jgi:tRNA (guanine-N7-)-methyltransferase
LDVNTLKAPPERLYGRVRGHRLRPRQDFLIRNFLPELAWPAPFGISPRELWLEVGFGGGEHAEALADAHPDIGLIAAEVFENGICSLLSRLAPEAGPARVPANLRLYNDDARLLIQELPDGGLKKLFLMFPDPWPKARHAKRRFVHPAALPELARVIAPGGEWRIASDDPTYQDWTDEVFANQNLFVVRSRVLARPVGWPATRYEAKAIAAGRRPVYWTINKG